MLNFDGRWRFESPGAVPIAVRHKFYEFIGRIASQGERWDILEHFKYYFAGAAGFTSHRSSSESWADSDLDGYIQQASENGPLFIEAFYDACEAILGGQPARGIPDVKMMNRVLRESDAGYEIKPPNLILLSAPSEPIAVAERSASLDQQAQELIQRSLKESDRLLSEGRNRPAVSEVLWLLETVSTALRGLDIGTATVQGDYFNKIVGELRRHHKGQTLDQILDLVARLHGYLSSPTGGIHQFSYVGTRPIGSARLAIKHPIPYGVATQNSVCAAAKYRRVQRHRQRRNPPPQISNSRSPRAIPPDHSRDQPRRPSRDPAGWTAAGSSCRIFAASRRDPATPLQVRIVR
jgi:hypothetical protein